MNTVFSLIVKDKQINLIIANKLSMFWLKIIEHLKQGLVNYGLVFRSKVLLEHNHAYSLFTVYGCFIP